MFGTFIPYQSYQLNINFSFIHLLHITVHSFISYQLSVTSCQVARKQSQPRVVLSSIHLISQTHTFLPSLLLTLLPFFFSPLSPIITTAPNY